MPPFILFKLFTYFYILTWLPFPLVSNDFWNLTSLLVLLMIRFDLFETFDSCYSFSGIYLLLPTLVIFEFRVIFKFSGKIYVVKELLQNGRQVKAETGEVFTPKLAQPATAGSRTFGTRPAERRNEQTAAQRANKWIGIYLKMRDVVYTLLLQDDHYYVGLTGSRDSLGNKLNKPRLIEI